MKKDFHLNYIRFTKNSIMKKANATRKYAKDVETLHQRDV